MKKGGFTLVELLAVICILALLMAIVIPSSIKLSNKVKNNAYNTKIELIEKAALNYGHSNMAYVKVGADFSNEERHYTCEFSFNEDEVTVNYNYETSGYDETKSLGNDTYWCSKISVEDLVGTNNLSWDETDKCKGNCKTEEEKKAYNNVIINSKSNYIINKCFIYIYVKNNRVYAHFDKKTCSIQSNVVTDGHEYKPL